MAQSWLPKTIWISKREAVVKSKDPAGGKEEKKKLNQPTSNDLILK